MRIRCLRCDGAMALQDAADSETQGLDMAFRCPTCDVAIAIETNAGETQMVRSLGVRIGGGGPATPLAAVREHLAQAPPGSGNDEGADPAWDDAARSRLAEHPRYVQPAVRKANIDYARRRGIARITPAVMDACRQDLGPG